MIGKLGKITRSGFALILVALTVLASPFIVKAAGLDYDFNSFTEYDPDSRLLKTQYIVTVNADRADDIGYVYKDMGAGYFQDDFAFEFVYSPYASSNGGHYGIIFWLTNTVDGYWPSFVTGHIGGVGMMSRTQPAYDIVWIASANSTGAASGTLAPTMPYGNDYYVIMWHDSDDAGAYGFGTLKCNVYSDYTHNSLLYSGEVDCVEAVNYRYISIFNMMEYPSSTDGNWWANVSYLTQYTSSKPPTLYTGNVTDIMYNPFSDKYYCYLAGNVTDDGGSDTTVGFQYREYGESAWTEIEVGEVDEDEEFTQYIDDDTLVLGEVYEYRVYGTNDFATNYGDTENFTFEFVLTDPVPTMLDWPLYYPAYVGDNVTFIGACLFDGGENCTGWFWYKEGEGGTWESLEGIKTTTDISTGMTWYHDLTIDPDTWYFVKATLENSHGTANSTNTISFIWYNSTAPDPITLAPDHDTDFDPFYQTVDITFNGYILDDGDSPCLVAFDYREYGETEYDTVYIDGEDWETGDNISYTMYGFNPNTAYEVRFKAANQATYNQVNGVYTYIEGDWVSTTTNAAILIPQVTTLSVTFMDSYTAEVGGRIDEDGGAECLGHVEYREKNISTGWQNVGMYAAELETGDTYYLLAPDLEYGTVYEFRCKAFNGKGWGTGFILEYTHLETGDTTTTVNDSGWVAWISAHLLAPIGMNNVGGKILFSVALMLFVFGICFAARVKWLGLGLAALIFVACISIGYIPLVISMIVVVVFAVIGFILFRKVLVGGGAAR